MVVVNLQKSRKYFSFYYKQKIMYLVSIMKHLSWINYFEECYMLFHDTVTLYVLLFLWKKIINLHLNF